MKNKPVPTAPELYGPAADLLRKTRELLAAPQTAELPYWAYYTGCWCKHGYARQKSGDLIGWAHPNAVAWSLEGALWRSTGRECGDRAGDAEKAATELLHRATGVRDRLHGLDTWNSRPLQTLDDVFDALDRAIAEAERGIK